MFKRVMVAVVGLPLLILILGWAPSWATMLLLAAMCAIGAWELMRAAAGERGKPLTPLTVIAAAAVPVCVYGEMSIENTELTALPVLPFAALLGAVFIFAIFALAIHREDEEQGIPFAAVTCAIFDGLAFPLMFSCLLRLLMMPAIGMLQVFLPLAISFGSDTFALFAGMLCGKHKLAPKVSPKKTVEGAIGGLLGGVIGMTVFKLVADSMAHTLTVYPPIEMAAGPQISWGAVFALGIIGSTISQIGDLSFSVIKREFGVKDYGNLLPGHGGILDRFDSVTFVAPFVWLALQLL
ncbi:MAG: phosphatidate cytidylyltransferase [Dysosmobacter welbionis]